MCTLRIQSRSNFQGVWIQLGNGIESRVDFLDSCNVCLLLINGLYHKKIAHELSDTLTLTRSTLENKPLFRPAASVSVVASSKLGNVPILDIDIAQLGIITLGVP